MLRTVRYPRAVLGETAISNGYPCILVTGGAGFIGSNFVLNWIASGKGRVINLDSLTYCSFSPNSDQASLFTSLRKVMWTDPSSGRKPF